MLVFFIETSNLYAFYRGSVNFCMHLSSIHKGNFVLGHPDSEDSSTVIIIDFGLSKKHLDSDGRPLPQRKSARWVGSRRYMSPNTHLRVHK